MKKSYPGIILASLLSAGVSAQSLFEDAFSVGLDQAASIGLNGYARGVLYLGEYNPPLNSEIRSTYGEAALKLSASTGQRASFYSEVRFRSGFEYGSDVNELWLREAYADLYLGPFELRAGQTVLAWGRADGSNPTNNLTPQDYFVRSPEPDDMRLGNFLLRARYNLSSKLRLEAVWVPVYKYSVYRFDLFEMPDYVRFSESPLPQRDLKSGSAGARIEFLFNGFDGSLSWFNGYDPMPGIQPGELPGLVTGDILVEMYARAFRQQTLGLDYSFGLGSFGVRGEAALRIPTSEYKEQIFAPNQDLRYLVEIDRSFGNFSLLAMYMGQYVFDFTEIPPPGGMPEIDPLMMQDPQVFAEFGPMMQQEVAAFNRIIFDQINEFTHVVALRPALEMFRGISRLELFGMYNIRTGEWGLRPQLTWNVSDNLRLSLGGEYFEGPVNTRLNLVAPVFNGGYFELRYSF